MDPPLIILEKQLNKDKVAWWKFEQETRPVLSGKLKSEGAMHELHVQEGDDSDGRPGQVPVHRWLGTVPRLPPLKLARATRRVVGVAVRLAVTSARMQLVT